MKILVILTILYRIYTITQIKIKFLLICQKAKTTVHQGLRSKSSILSKTN